jgi:transcriptional regulator with XRE-family HTH domain
MKIQGKLIKAYRERHNISQPEFAKIIDVVQPVISYIERGDRTPKPDLAIAIEQATNGEIKAEWLVFPEKYQEEIEEYLNKEKAGVSR